MADGTIGDAAEVWRRLSRRLSRTPWTYLMGHVRLLGGYSWFKTADMHDGVPTTTTGVTQAINVAEGVRMDVTGALDVVEEVRVG